MSKTTKSSPKTVYIVLGGLTGFMGAYLLYSWANGETSSLGLYLSIFFFIASALVFRQYKKDK